MDHGKAADFGVRLQDEPSVRYAANMRSMEGDSVYVAREPTLPSMQGSFLGSNASQYIPMPYPEVRDIVELEVTRYDPKPFKKVVRLPRVRVEAVGGKVWLDMPTISVLNVHEHIDLEVRVNPTRLSLADNLNRPLIMHVLAAVRGLAWEVPEASPLITSLRLIDSKGQSAPAFIALQSSSPLYIKKIHAQNPPSAAQRLQEGSEDVELSLEVSGVIYQRADTRRVVLPVIQSSLLSDPFTGVRSGRALQNAPTMD